MEKDKIYISGKITGLLNFENNFNRAERELTKMGFQVVNPIKIKHDHDKSWKSHMKEDLKALLDCDAIFMLNNHSDSAGAMIELRLAQSLNYRIIYQ